MFVGQCETIVYQKSNQSCACGFFLRKGLTWNQAFEGCKFFNARLPEIYSARENADILKLRVKYPNIYLNL